MLPQVRRFSKWLQRKSPHASTPIHYANDLDLFFTWLDKPPDAVTFQDIDHYIEHCQQNGHAIATVNRRLAAIRSFYGFLDSEDEDDLFNPVHPRRHYIRQGQHLPRDVQDADIEQLFTVIENRRDRAMFLLMLRCGLRVGEVHSLSLSDLYLNANNGHSTTPRLWLHGKGDAQRVVYVSHQALKALHNWLTVRPQAQSQAVFLSRLRQRISVRTIQDRLTRYGRQVGIDISCHQLRHTFARHLVDAGVSVTSIQKLLGHARLHTTQLYLHISDPTVRAEYEAAIAEISRRLSLAEDEA